MKIWYWVRAIRHIFRTNYLTLCERYARSQITCVFLTLIKYPHPPSNLLHFAFDSNSSQFCHWHLWRLCVSSYVWKFGRPIFHMCEDYVPVIHTCEFWYQFFHMWWVSTIFFHRYKGLVPNLHTSEFLVPIFHIMLVLHTLKTIQMWNFSTNFTPQILSKLTVRKFHIYQKWSIGNVRCPKVVTLTHLSDCPGLETLTG